MADSILHRVSLNIHSSPPLHTLTMTEVGMPTIVTTEIENNQFCSPFDLKIQLLVGAFTKKRVRLLQWLLFFSSF